MEYIKGIDVLMKMNQIYIILIFILFTACDNPFAPSLNKEGISDNILGDQTTVEGLFQNFRYSYIMKDTVIYSGLLDKDFIFEYYDYEKNVSVTYGREEDMLTTYRLFQASDNLDLIWNEVIISGGGNDSLKILSRGFTLNVSFSPSDVISVYGRVNLRIIKREPSANWKILKWKDESVY
jgi:hypothetical protein